MSKACPIVDKNICSALGISNNAYLMAARKLIDRNEEITRESIEKELMTPATVVAINSGFSSLIRSYGHVIDGSLSPEKVEYLKLALAGSFPATLYRTFTRTDGSTVIILNNIVSGKADTVNEDGTLTTPNSNAIVSDGKGAYLNSDYLNIKYSAQEQRGDNTVYGGDRNLDDSMCKAVARELYKLRKLGIVCNTAIKKVDAKQGSIDVTPDDGAYNISINLPSSDIGANALQGVKQVVANIINDVQKKQKETIAQEKQKEKDAVRLGNTVKTFGGIGVTELDKAVFGIMDAIALKMGIKNFDGKTAITLMNKFSELYQPRTDSAKEYFMHIKDNGMKYVVRYLMHKGVKITPAHIRYLTDGDIEKTKEIYQQLQEAIKSEDTIDDTQTIEADEEEDNNGDEDGNANSIWKKDYFTAKDEDFGDDDALKSKFGSIPKNALLSSFPTFYTPQEVIAGIKNTLANSESVEESYRLLQEAAKKSRLMSGVLARIESITNSEIKNRFITRVHSKYALRETSFFEYDFGPNGRRFINKGESNTHGTNRLNAAIFGLIQSPDKIAKNKAKLLDVLNHIADLRYDKKQLENELNDFINTTLGLAEISNGVDVDSVRNNFNANTLKTLIKGVNDGDVSVKDIYSLRNIFISAVRQADEQGKVTVVCSNKSINRYLAPSFLQNIFNKKISKLDRKGFIDFIKAKFKPGFFYEETANGNIIFHNPLLRNLFDGNLARREFDFAYLTSPENAYMENLTASELKRSDLEMYMRFNNGVTAYVPLPMQSLKKSWNYIKVPIYRADVASHCVADITGMVIREAQLKGIAKKHKFVKNASLSLFTLEQMKKDSENNDAVERYNELLKIAEERELTSDEKEELSTAIEYEMQLRSDDYCADIELKNGEKIDKYIDAFYNMQTNMIAAYSLLATSPMFFKSEEDSFKRLAGAHSLGTQMASGTKMRYVVIEDIKGLVSELSETLKGVGLDDVDFTDGQGYESSIARKEKLIGTGLSEHASQFEEGKKQLIPRKPLIYTVSDTPVSGGAFGIDNVPIPVMMKFAEAVLPTTRADENNPTFGEKLDSLLGEIKEKTGITIHGVTFTSSTKGVAYNTIPTKDLVERLNKKEITYDQFNDELLSRIRGALLDSDGRFLETGCMSFDSSGYQYVATTHDNFTNSSLNVSSQFQAAFSVDDKLGDTINDEAHNMMAKKPSVSTSRTVAAQALKDHNELLAENCITRPGDVEQATLYHIDDKMRALFSAIKRSIKFTARGGHLYQVCSLLTHELTIKHTGDKMDYVEVEIPLPSTNDTGKYVNEHGEVDTDAVMRDHPEWCEFIAYRTPTEGLQSIVPCRVKRFLPTTHAGEIRLPKEITFFTGSDFDGDSYNIVFKNDRYGKLYESMWNILTAPGSLKNYSISGFANEAKIIHEMFESDADAITPISLNRRYSSYKAVNVAGIAVGIFAKQKTLHLLSLRGKKIPNVKLSPCTVEGKPVNTVAAVTKVSPFDGYITSNRLGALVGASVDILTDNIFFPMNLNIDNINYFITSVRAGFSFRLSCAICKSPTMNNIMSNPELSEVGIRELTDKVKQFMMEHNVDSVEDVNITPELLLKENPTTKEKIAMLNFYCNLVSLKIKQSTLDKANKNYSLNSAKADEWSGMAKAVGISALSKIKWINEEQKRYLDVLDNVFGVFANTVIRESGLKNPQTIKKMFNLYTVYQAFNNGFTTNDEIDELIENQSRLYEKCPDYFKKFLQLRHRGDVNDSDFRVELTRVNLTKPQEADFENAYELLFQDNPKLALDLFKLSLVRYGMFFSAKGFCHLAPVNMMKAMSVRIGDETVVGPNAIMSSLDADASMFLMNAEANGVLDGSKRLSKDRFVIGTTRGELYDASQKYSTEDEDYEFDETDDGKDYFDDDFSDVDDSGNDDYVEGTVRHTQSVKTRVDAKTNSTLASVSANLGIKLNPEDMECLDGVCGL